MDEQTNKKLAEQLDKVKALEKAMMDARDNFQGSNRAFLREMKRRLYGKKTFSDTVRQRLNKRDDD